MHPKDEIDYKRFFLAVFLAASVLLVWQAKVEWPRRQILAQMAAADARKLHVSENQHVESLPVKDNDAQEVPSLDRAGLIAASPRITLDSDKLHGSINLQGARFDDIRLAHYHVSQDPDSPDVTLLSPNADIDAYFAQIGWVSPDKAVRVPDQHTPWQADRKTLTAGQTVHLHWDNGAGVTFKLAVALDEDYMFTVSQSAENHSGHAVSVTPYAYINREYDLGTEKKDAPGSRNRHYMGTPNAILHEGPLGVMNGALSEISYKDLRDHGSKVFDDTSGWFGITDKYWLAALIPAENHVKITYSYYSKNGGQRYQVDYLGQPEALESGASGQAQVRLFAGAKEVKLLDRYAAGDAARHEPPIPLFDRAVDFGMLYFITKPMFMTLNFFFAQTGNFGVAILLLTVCVKLAMFPLANKSYKATSQMRTLQPEMVKLRERYADDQMALNKEMMNLYKREKVNPASGCLPIVIQMPVFFSLYKVLYVTLEMRQAPFFGWIRDLSSPDPSNLFTAFGLIPWDGHIAFALFGSPFNWHLHLGILPMLMCATMVIQMRQQPKPADPVQARMIRYMPYFFLIIFANMPAGLVLYWTWSNLISIIQQRVITKRHGGAKSAAAALTNPAR